MAKIMINPIKKRKKRSKKRAKTKGTTVSVKRTTTKVVKRRKNPIRKRGIAGVLSNTVIPGATAAGGALALDVVWGMLPIPENLKSGPIRHVAKAAGAIGIGMLAAMFTKSATANLIATGAMTVVMHNAGKEMLGRVAPQLNLGEYEDDGMGYGAAGESAGYYDETPSGVYEADMGEYEEMSGGDDLDGIYDDISEMGEYEEVI